jgi:hypothetical protein
MGSMQYYSIGDHFLILHLGVNEGWVRIAEHCCFGTHLQKKKKKIIFLDCPRKFVRFWSLAFIGQHQSEPACRTNQEQPKVFSSKTFN